MMWWGDGYGMGATGVVWMVIMLAVLALIVVGIVLLVRSAGGRRDSDTDVPSAGAAGDRTPGASTPLQILEQRYARGEVDREEFLQRKADLQS